MEANTGRREALEELIEDPRGVSKLRRILRDKFNIDEETVDEIGPEGNVYQRKKDLVEEILRLESLSVAGGAGVEATTRPTELQSLKPTGEELKAIVLKRKVNDDFDTRVANRLEFFDKARELLQSADTITIDYESHFTPEFKELLAKHSDVNFLSLPEFEKYKLASDFNFLKEVIGALFGRILKEVEGVFMSDSSVIILSVITVDIPLEKVFIAWYYSILGFKYGIAAEPMDMYLAKVGEMYLLFFEYQRYHNFEDLLSPHGYVFKPLAQGVSDVELEEAIKYSISLTRSWLKHIKPTMDSLSICHRDNHYHNIVYDTNKKRWIMIDWDTTQEVEEIPIDKNCEDTWPPVSGGMEAGVRPYFQFITDILDTMGEEELVASVKKYLGK